MNEIDIIRMKCKQYNIFTKYNGVVHMCSTKCKFYSLSSPSSIKFKKQSLDCIATEICEICEHNNEKALFPFDKEWTGKGYLIYLLKAKKGVKDEKNT